MRQGERTDLAPVGSVQRAHDVVQNAIPELARAVVERGVVSVSAAVNPSYYYK